MDEQRDVKKVKQPHILDSISYADDIPQHQISYPNGADYITCTFCGNWMESSRSDYPFTIKEELGQVNLLDDVWWCDRCNHLTYDYCCRHSDTGCTDQFEFPCCISGIRFNGRFYQGTPIVSPDLLEQFMEFLCTIDKSYLHLYCGCNTKCISNKCCWTGKPGLGRYRPPVRWVLDDVIYKGIDE